MSERLAIEARGLRRTFGAFEALKGVDLRVPGGSIFGLVGPNGAGKTTTFSILCGFLSPSAGEVRVLGCDPRDRASLGARVGALPQDAPLPARMRAVDALRYYAELCGLAPDDARAEAMHWLRTVGLEAHAHKRNGELSHGMGKRVALAQAFLGGPELVLLDEPTSGLDPKTAYEIKQVIRAQRGRRTVVVSSHDLAQIEELCDGVAIIDKGRVLQQGALGEVTGQGELVRVSLADEAPELLVAAVRGLACVQQVRFDAATRVLEVRIQGAPEDAVPAVLRAALEHGGRVVGLTRGQRLEERVLQLT
jgi:ABC-2 type transport system ATP-binding protein